MSGKSEALANVGTPAAAGLAPIQSALEEIREKFKGSTARGGVTVLKHFPAREAQIAPIPEFLPARLLEALKARGIASLYTHQARACELAHEGRNVVVEIGRASCRERVFGYV